MSHFWHVSDLNAELRESVAFSGTGDAHARRQIGVRPVDGSSSVEVLRSHRRALRRRSSDPWVQLRQSVPLHGLRATDLPRELARHRDLPSCAVCQALPSGYSGNSGKLHAVNVLDELLPEPGAFYVMDRGYLDFERLHRLHLAGAFFVTRAKSNLKAQRRYSHPLERSTGLICDQTLTLTVFYSQAGYPEALRRIRFKTEEGKTLVFLTNNFALPALTITELYRCRWQVELFFKWIKQHLRIKSFFGTSENA